MHIISFATPETKWSVPRLGMILHVGDRDTGYRLDCEKLFPEAEHPSNPLAWFDMDGPWFQKARATHDTLIADEQQDSNTDQLIFGVPALIEFLSESITLEPGDVIATGTPPGVGFARNPPVFLKAGDQMEVLIEGMGGPGNPVVSESE
jgi:2-keto-4-pentenoate hydratase/2-oxohepta-3-ene-1,7-dioic acid hydratase in catechol pathway